MENANENKTFEEMSGIERAAIIIVSIGADRASEIFKYLNEEEIEELAYAVAKIKKFNDEQVETTLSEFNKMCMAHQMLADGGVEYARKILEKAFGEVAAENLLDKVTKNIQAKPFYFFEKGDPKAVASVLQNERPQVIAIILSYIDPEPGAMILEQLGETKRMPTVEALANMDRVSPEAINLVEEEMRRKFANMITSDENMSIGGVDYVADIMNHIDRQSEKQIFDQLEAIDPELTQEIKDKMFVFEDILKMDDRSIQRFIRDLDSKDIVYSLKAANQEMQNIFFKNMSKRMMETIKSDLEITTNVRLRDVEEAQQRIVTVIRKLEVMGELVINNGGAEDEIIV